MSRASHRAPLRRLSLVVALATSACRGGDPSAGGDTGGSLVIVHRAQPETLFPPRVYGTTLGDAPVDAVFDKLAEIGPSLNTFGDAEFAPRLAKSWTWAADSLSIAFAIHPDARWHDGVPVRSEDVRFTFATYTSDAVASQARSLLGNIDSVSVPDSLTARFWFKRRTPQQFLDATYHMYILPAHLLAKTPPAQLGDAPFGKAPVGTGRFRFVSWQNDRLELLADTANWRRRPKLDRVVWTFVDDMGAATVKLFAGEADLLESVRLDDLGEVARSADLRLELISPLIYSYLSFNLERAGERGTPNPFFADLRVRRAITMALDRERLVRTVFDSLGQVAFSSAPRVLIPDTSALKPLPFDPSAASALLDSAGWIDRNGDGIREKNGVAFSFDITVPATSATRQQYAELIQQQLKAVGIDAKPLVLDLKPFLERVENRRLDATIGSWSMTPGGQGLRQTWASYGASNCCSYASPVFDALLDSALTTFNGQASRKYWGRVFQTMIDEAPSVWLYEQRIPFAFHKRVRTPPLRPDAWYANLAEWSIDPSQRIERDRIGLRTAARTGP